MKCQTKILRIGFIGIILSLLAGQSPFVLDSTLTSSIIQSISNSIEVGDINNARGYVAATGTTTVDFSLSKAKVAEMCFSILKI